MQVSEFAESLVYDSNSDKCMVSDETTRRELQSVTKSDDCQRMNCFNCSETAGRCIWDSGLRKCLLPPKGYSQNDKKWWEWFLECEDDLGLCSSNIEAMTKMSGGDVITALDNDNEISFSIIK